MMVSKIQKIVRKKNKSKITMLTCYDYSFAKILDETSVDIILIGDSLANVVLGLNETKEVSMSEMFNHTKAVSKAVRKALVVADMPYVAYQKNIDKSLVNALRFIKCGAQAVKIEWFEKCEIVARELTRNGVSVMGHIGLTPQTVHLLGGYKVQGRDQKSIQNLLKQAKLLEKAGVFSIVLECIPSKVAKRITKSVKIPTIGIGAGNDCDGQVLVLYDLLGIYKEKVPKFVRQYCNFYSNTKKAIKSFIGDVEKGKFPGSKESFL